MWPFAGLSSNVAKRLAPWNVADYTHMILVRTKAGRLDGDIIVRAGAECGTFRSQSCECIITYGVVTKPLILLITLFPCTVDGSSPAQGLLSNTCDRRGLGMMFDCDAGKPTR